MGYEKISKICVASWELKYMRRLKDDANVRSSYQFKIWLNDYITTSLLCLYYSIAMYLCVHYTTSLVIRLVL